ncbi:hCG2005973 [Homo sapiens]|nr:hCG2005973 [Homo sapiens]
MRHDSKCQTLHKKLLLLDSKLLCPLYQWLTRHIGIYAILRGVKCLDSEPEKRELSLKKLETSFYLRDPGRPLGLTGWYNYEGSTGCFLYNFPSPTQLENNL